MPSPIPKDPATRQRRNKPISRANLPAENDPRQKAPPLPTRKTDEGEKIPWHFMTRRWWKDVWSSPMAQEYVRADEHGLYRLAVLINMFWNFPTKDLAGEIRLQEQRYGLSPLDRRRLEWSVAQAEEAKDKHHNRRSGRARQIQGNDPRNILDG